MTDYLLNHAWINQLAQYSVLYVGYSGGLDSAVLLHNLAIHPSLSQKLKAVHVNHGLSPNALNWEKQCQTVCDTLKIPFMSYQVHLSLESNLEERARTARYEIFKSLLTSEDALILAHHQDDQAETLLLNLLRGSGVDGMAAMLAVQSYPFGDIVRPLLSFSRAALMDYASHHQLTWVNDESNTDERFSRNFLRHRIMPLLKEKWPAAIETIARGASHCQQAKRNLTSLAHIDSPDLATKHAPLNISTLKHLSRERTINVLRTWLMQYGHRLPSEKTLGRLINEMILARTDSAPQISFGQVVVRRYRQALYCCLASTVMPEPTLWLNFPESLTLGQDLGTLYVQPSNQGFVVPLSSKLEVRFRRGGELFRWRGQTKSLKKLFQQWQVLPWMRDSIPLIYLGEELVCVVGHAVSDLYYHEKSPSCQPMRIIHNLRECHG